MVKNIIKKMHVKTRYLSLYLYKKYYQIIFSEPSLHIHGRIKIIGKFENIKLGKNIHLNEGVILNSRDKIIIGNNVTISPYVQIHTGMLDTTYYKNFVKHMHISKPVIIEDNVWIASGAIISPGVRIGKNSIIGAGSVVTRDIPSNSFAAGCPAKVIKKLWKEK